MGSGPPPQGARERTELRVMPPRFAQGVSREGQRVELNRCGLGKTHELQKTGKMDCLLEKITTRIYHYVCLGLQFVRRSMRRK